MNISLFPTALDEDTLSGIPKSVVSYRTALEARLLKVEYNVENAYNLGRCIFNTTLICSAAQDGKFCEFSLKIYKLKDSLSNVRLANAAGA